MLFHQFGHLLISLAGIGLIITVSDQFLHLIIFQDFLEDLKGMAITDIHGRADG